jgi:hypothetical protein
MFRRILTSVALTLLALPRTLSAQSSVPAGQPPIAAPVVDDHYSSRPLAMAVERSQAIALDGVLDEAVWAGGSPATNFRQFEPRSGEPGQRTEVRFAYDEEAFYIGARMFDSLGAAGVRTRLVRRDQITEGDYIQFVFDTYHDHAGRTVFTMNPSGVKGDAGQASSFADPSWDPVWNYSARVDSLGWTLEARIPWSQLRFSRDSAQSWGMQVWRYTERLNETSMWTYWRRDESGGPQVFGHLQGLRVRGRSRGLEIMPYMVSRASYVQPTQNGSPFQDESRYDARVGADMRMMLGSSLTLSATINPDFGQVEQDPAVVNLSAFESFFEEKRPFFVEGSGLLSFGGLNCYTCSNVSGMSLFYSRRIGRSPQGGLPGGVYDFSEVPRNTRLLGAAKLTGRTSGGWQIGLLEAVTAREVAQVQDLPADASTYSVEPLTNYWMGRVRRTTAGGRVTWGAMATSVMRRFGDDDEVLRPQLASHAEALGFDWNLYTKGQTYRLMGNFAMSNVGGDSLAIRRLQRSSARYFQRPDREGGGNGIFSDEYDTSVSGLRGFGGYLRASKDQGAWLWETAVNYRSPGFEVNDMAFLTRSDYVWMNANVLRQWTRPGSWYRNLTWIGGGQQQVNFDGDRNDLQFHTYLGGQLKNYWNASIYTHYRPEVDDDRATRGGPVVRRSSSWYVGPGLSTDGRKPIVFSVNPGFGGTGDGGSFIESSASVRLKPATNVQVSLGPSYNYSHSMGQFVRRFDDPTATAMLGNRVVFAELEQRTVSMNARVNWTFSPELTLELFAQPFIATGEYRNFREFTRPRSLERVDYDATQLTENRDEQGNLESYTLDADRNAETTNFTFGNPDFNVRSLRGNAVLRWEYRPGSTLFFVWQQERAGSNGYGDFDLGRDVGNIFDQHPNNVFVIKASYWIGR